MSNAFIWYELMTPDADGAAKFYGDVVGWRIASSKLDHDGIDYRHIARSDGGSNGGVLQLSDEMCNGGAHPGWLGYLYVADVDKTVAAIQADGGKVLMPKTTIDVGSFALVTDPQGIPIYVMTPVPPPGQPDAQSDVYDRTTPQHVSWNELWTPDIDGARAFYAKHFGFQFNDKMPMGEMGDYWFITTGTMHDAIGAMMQKPPHVPVPGWNYYIHVEDIDVAAQAVKDGGGQVLNGPMEVPGGDWIIQGMDPQGAAFALVGARKG